MNMNALHASKQPKKGYKRRETEKYDLGLTAKEKAALRSILEWEARHNDLFKAGLMQAAKAEA